MSHDHLVRLDSTRLCFHNRRSALHSGRLLEHHGIGLHIIRSFLPLPQRNACAIPISVLPQTLAILPLMHCPCRSSMSKPVRCSSSTSILFVPLPLQPCKPLSHSFPSQIFSPLCAESSPPYMSPFLSPVLPRTLSAPKTWALISERLALSSSLRTRSYRALAPSSMAQAEIRVCRRWRAGATRCDAKDNETHLPEFAAWAGMCRSWWCEWQSQLLTREALVELYNESTD
jgi:hypothetical protein